jgi:hypothetical protein
MLLFRRKKKSRTKGVYTIHSRQMEEEKRWEVSVGEQAVEGCRTRTATV